MTREKTVELIKYMGLIGAIFIAGKVVVAINETRSREIAKDEISKYDKMVTQKQEQLWDTTNARLLRISEQLRDGN